MSLGKDELKEESLYQKINNLDRRYIWWVLTIMLMIILIRPLNIPLQWTQPTKDTVIWLESLEPGDVILFSNDDTTTIHLVLGEVVDDVFRYFLENDIKFVIMSLQQPGVTTTQYSLNTVPNLDSYEYGVDYVQFGFYSGMETVVSAMVTDVWGALGADVDGTPVSEIPLMQNLKTAKDFDGWFETGGGGEFLYYLKNWYVAEGIPGSCAQSGANIPLMVTWYENGYLEGYVADQRGTVELTQMLGYPSTFVAMLDAQSVGHMFLVALIIVGNIFYINERLTTRSRV